VGLRVAGAGARDFWHGLLHFLHRAAHPLRLPEIYGVLTPAAAMGDALLARFPGAGISLHSTRLNANAL